MSYLLRHLLQYHQHVQQAPKVYKFSGNEIALLHALTEEPQNTKELADKVGVETTTILRIIKRLNESHGGIEVQSFGRSAPALYWKSDDFDSIYDEI